MSYGPIAVYTVTMASGATSTSELDLARSWKTAWLVVPSMASNTQMGIKAATEAGGTYRSVYHPQINSSTVSVNSFAIASSTTSAMVPIPNGFRFIKIHTTATCDSGETFKVICSD